MSVWALSPIITMLHFALILEITPLKVAQHAPLDQVAQYASLGHLKYVKRFFCRQTLPVLSLLWCMHRCICGVIKFHYVLAQYHHIPIFDL